MAEVHGCLTLSSFVSLMPGQGEYWLDVWDRGLGQSHRRVALGPGQVLMIAGEVWHAGSDVPEGTHRWQLYATSTGWAFPLDQTILPSRADWEAAGVAGGGPGVRRW